MTRQRRLNKVRGFEFFGDFLRCTYLGNFTYFVDFDELPSVVSWKVPTRVLARKNREVSVQLYLVTTTWCDYMHYGNINKDKKEGLTET